MENLNLCKFVRTFSKLDGLQKAYYVSYQFDIIPSGVKFEVTQADSTSGESNTINFVCYEVDYKTAHNIAMFLYENAISVDQCIDILRDYSIPFELLNYNT